MKLRDLINVLDEEMHVRIFANNKRLADYLPEVLEVFDCAGIINGMIIAVK